MPNVFTVDDATLKGRNPNAWAITSDGTIYISDAIPAELADVVGYHEVIHAVKQNGNRNYLDFADTVGSRINLANAQPMALELVVQSRYPGKTLLDLSADELDTVYDELNALVWGYHKADPENARAQFAGVFQDYDAYIRELDAILEQARSGAVGPESSVGAARKGFDPYSAFLGTKSEFFPEGANAARPVDVPTTDAQGNPIRKTASTAMGAKAIPDNVVLDIQNMVMNGDLSYQVATDKAAITRAISTIQADGFQRSLQQFSDSVQKGVVSKDMAALGQQLLVNAANAGDSNATAEILSLYAQMETVKKAKASGEKMSKAEKKELTEAEKEFKTKRKEIQEKLVKFATRIPIFMYLTDYRERSLKDVITQLEPGLFKKVTGLDVKDFDLLCSLGVFNANLMNDAIFKFKRYEDASLTYTGVDNNSSKDVGGWDTVLKREEYEKLFYNQQATMSEGVTSAVLSSVAHAVEPTPVAEKKEDIDRASGSKISTTTPVTANPPIKPLQLKKQEGYVPPIAEPGTEVAHSKFGTGVVTKLDKSKKYIHIKFAEGEKAFIYPDAFKNNFLHIKEEV